MADAEDAVVKKKSQLMQYLEDGKVSELLFKKDGKVERRPVSECKFLTEERVGIYFSAHWCGPCQAFTPVLAKKYEELQKQGLTIIFMSADRDLKMFNEYYGEMPWAAFPFENKQALQESAAIPESNGIPSLYLFNKGKLYNENGRFAIMNMKFPYEPLAWEKIIGSEAIIDGNYEVVPTEDIKKKKYLAFYFSAHWCPPCQKFTPKLIETYNKMQARAKENGEEPDFEFIYVSSDKHRSMPEMPLDEFKKYFGKMPWKAFNVEHELFGDISQRLGYLAGKRGIPHLTIMTADGEMVEKDAMAGASSDSEGTDFPWKTKPWYDVEDSLQGINEAFVIMLMMPNLTEEQRATHAAFLTEHGTKQLDLGDSRQIYHFTVTDFGEDKVGPKLQQLTGVKDDKMVVLFIRSGTCKVLDLPKTSEEVEKAFDLYLEDLKAKNDAGLKQLNFD